MNSLRLLCIKKDGVKCSYIRKHSSICTINFIYDLKLSYFMLLMLHVFLYKIFLSSTANLYRCLFFCPLFSISGPNFVKFSLVRSYIPLSTSFQKFFSLLKISSYFKIFNKDIFRNKINDSGNLYPTYN